MRQYKMPSIPEHDEENTKEGREIIANFLRTARVWYLATVNDEGKPIVRPMSLITLYGDQELVFGTTKEKDVVKHLLTRPECSISAYIPKMGWLQINTEAKPAADQERVEALLREEDPEEAQKFLEENVHDNCHMALVKGHAEWMTPFGKRIISF